LPYEPNLEAAKDACSLGREQVLLESLKLVVGQFLISRLKSRWL